MGVDIARAWLSGLGRYAEWLPGDVLLEIIRSADETHWLDRDASMKVLNALSHSAEGNLEKALLILNAISKNSPRFPDSLIVRARIEMLLGDLDGVLRTVREAEACHPDPISLVKSIRDIVAGCETALLSPDDSKFTDSAFEVLSDTGCNPLEESQRDSSTVLDPPHSENRWLSMLGDYIDWLPENLAIEIAESPNEIDWCDPLSVMKILNACSQYISDGDSEKAFCLLNGIDERSERYLDSLLVKARIQLDNGDYDEMIQTLQRAEQTQSNTELFEREVARIMTRLSDVHRDLERSPDNSQPDDFHMSTTTSDKGSCSTLSDKFQPNDLRHDVNVSSINGTSYLCTSEIPRKLHFVWVGDPDRCPNNLIDTWRDKNPSCSVTVWGNFELFERDWITKALMHKLFDQRIYCGVADLMRYEILLNEGGVAIDADSECLRSLPEFIFKSEVFAAWESEIARPGLIANGTMGAVAGSKFLIHILEEIINEKNLEGKQAWQVFGPGRLTHTYRKFQYHKLVIHPSYYFTPEHFTGVRYDGNGESFARQFWATTRGAS